MISPHKSEVQSVARMLDAAEYETVDDLAHALLTKAWELYESRACRYVVLGVDRSDQTNRGMYTFGPFPSEAQARTFGRGIADGFRWWLLSLRTGLTAAAFRKERAEALALTEAERTIAETKARILAGLEWAHREGTVLVAYCRTCGVRSRKPKGVWTHPEGADHDLDLRIEYPFDHAIRGVTGVPYEWVPEEWLHPDLRRQGVAPTLDTSTQETQEG